jgi:hypothetical protein
MTTASETAKLKTFIIAIQAAITQFAASPSEWKGPRETGGLFNSGSPTAPLDVVLHHLAAHPNRPHVEEHVEGELQPARDFSPAFAERG